MSDYGCMLRAYRRTIVDAMLACRERKHVYSDPGQRFCPSHD